MFRKIAFFSFVVHCLSAVSISFLLVPWGRRRRRESYFLSEKRRNDLFSLYNEIGKSANWVNNMHILLLANMWTSFSDILKLQPTILISMWSFYLAFFFFNLFPTCSLVHLSLCQHLVIYLLLCWFFLGLFLGTSFLCYINRWWLEEAVHSEAETTRSYLSF